MREAYILLWNRKKKRGIGDMANFTELDRYLFGQATHYEIYRKLGAHFTEEKGVKGVCFDLWAPNARRVFVIGTFNGWEEAHMR